MVSELKKRTNKSKKIEDGEPVSSDVTPILPVTTSPSSSNSTNEIEVSAPLRYGPVPSFSGQRLWSRSALILGLMAVVYFNSTVKESSFGKYGENVSGKAFETKCSSRLETELVKYEGCKVSKCGRILTDGLIHQELTFGLEDLGTRIFTVANGESGIYDLMTGKLVTDKESDLVLMNSSGQSVIFRTGDLQFIQATETKVRRLISEHFQLDYWKLKLSTVFYTHITPSGKKKDHLTKPIVHQDSFASQFSAIISLGDYGVDFKGGRLIFPDSDSTNRTVESQKGENAFKIYRVITVGGVNINFQNVCKGRVVAFTSGLENQHVIEPVTKGKLISLVLGFTCDPRKKIGTIKLP